MLCFGIDFWRKYPIEEFREMGFDELEFAGDQRILGERHEELNRGRRASPAGRAVTLAPLARHGNLLKSPVVVQVAHRRFPLRGRGEGASGSASIAAIASSAVAKFSSDGCNTGKLSFTGLPLSRLLRFLSMLHFPS